MNESCCSNSHYTEKSLYDGVQVLIDKIIFILLISKSALTYVILIYIITFSLLCLLISFYLSFAL